MEKIDFVITWVDGNDKKWQEEKNKVLNIKSTKSDARYRDWENLKYIFRGIEKYANWVNKIYFVTWGHTPNWLNTENEKLVIVNHKDYIPEEYLPTYSSHVIEMNFHRIKELSENFVYLNDDTFFIDKLEPTDFFKNGKPVDYAMLTTIISDTKANELFPHVLLNNMNIINRNFNLKESMKKNIFKWFSPKYGKDQIRTLCLLPWKKFTGLKFSHLPSPLKKSTMKEVWEKEGDVLNKTCLNKTRQFTDVNQYVFKSWQIAKGEFYPLSVKTGKLYSIKDDNKAIISEILNRKYKMCCLNDSSELKNFEKAKEEINGALEQILPDKCSFEK